MLTPGTRLGPYEIAARIGEGGMGVVYQATDTNLKRAVAMKVLPDAVARDPERLARFRREAEVLAALNHPHIAQIYGLETSGPTHALVMELVEGPTLADRIAAGPLPVDEALAIAKQIADALEVAHEQRIVHRDLKPANVKVRPDGSGVGTVKVLDFGLAKAVEPTGSVALGLSMSPTITTPAMTQAGTLLGTAAYMSPEQARGKPVDRRADVWAFGCVVYEMLTGRRAFEAEDISLTLAEVMKSEPDWTRLPSLPPAVATYLKRCFEKDPHRRVQSMGDMRLVLEGSFDVASPPVVPAGSTAPIRRQPLWRRAVPIAAAALIAAATTGLVMWGRAPVAQPRPFARFAFDLPQALRNTGRNTIALSPDGRSIAYNANGGLRVRALGDLVPRLVPGAEGGLASPTFSPDGQFVAYWDTQARQVKRLPTAGGVPVTVAAAPFSNLPIGMSWGADGSILVGTTEGIFRVSAQGGEPQLVVASEQSPSVRPQALPGGEAILYSTYANEVIVYTLATKERTVVLRGAADAQYVPSGHLVYTVDQRLLAVAFDIKSRTTSGTPFPLADDVMRVDGSLISNVAVSSDGALAYISGSDGARTLVWVDRQGLEEPIPVPPRRYAYAQLSPDGTRVAVDIRDQENDIWIWDLTRRALQRLTFDAGSNRAPVWTPDGRRVAFSRATDTGEEVYWQNADGSGAPEPLTHDSKRQVLPSAFAPDASALLFEGTGGPRDLEMVRVGASSDGRVSLLATKADEYAADISPNGKYVAYQSNESGREEVYVRPFPNVDSGRWQISTEGGTRPHWSKDGRELFYLMTTQAREGSAILTAAVDTGPAFKAGPPTKLFEGPYLSPQASRPVFDVSKDGKRFLMIKAVPNVQPPQVVYIQNWVDEMKRAAPAN